MLLPYAALNAAILFLGLSWSRKWQLVATVCGLVKPVIMDFTVGCARSAPFTAEAEADLRQTA